MFSLAPMLPMSDVRIGLTLVLYEKSETFFILLPASGQLSKFVSKFVRAAVLTA